MPALEITTIPTRLARAVDQVGVERRLQRGAKKGSWQSRGIGRAKLHRLLETTQRMRRQALLDPGPERRRRPLQNIGSRRHSPSSTAGFRRQPQLCGNLRTDDVVVRLAVPRHGGIEIDETPDATRRLLGDGGYDGSAVTVADEHNVAKVLEFQHAKDIRDMRLKPDLGAEQMRSLTKAGQGRANRRMTGGLEIGGDIAPAPAAKPGAGHKKEFDHSLPLPGASLGSQRINWLAQTKGRPKERPFS